MTSSTIQVKGSVLSGCPFLGQYQGRMGCGMFLGLLIHPDQSDFKGVGESGI
jgi:hypothetical protein